MKKFCILPLIAALAFFVSCQKQQSEEEKKAEVERQVQARLAAERQADERERLAKQQADLEAREKALAAKEVAAVEPDIPAEPNVPGETAMEEPVEAPQTVRRTRDPSETRSTASYGTFYRKLEPYGAWRETTDYGYVWQPREAEERNWRPYTDGRWVYTDAGWTWISEEPFGWATYHYGRWVRLRRVGWVWVPGEEWAPAWVSWRTSKDYVGWAPLPPEARFDRRHGIRNWADNHYDIGPDQYSFVPNNEFGSERIQRSVVPVERNITIVVETTNVTNITFSNTTIVNQGPNFEEMRTRSRRPLERYRLERQVNAETTERPTVRGEVLVMSAPAITTIPGVDRPQTVKETITEATVEKTWTADTDRPAAERARAKMKAEAAPPADAPSKTFVKPVSSTTSITPPAATAAPTSASPVTTPTTPAAASPASSPNVRATPAVPTPTPAPITRETPKPASPTAAPTARTTPVAIPNPTPSVLASPTPVPSVRVTPKPASPASAPTAASTVPAISTPSILASPSARPRHSVPPPRPSPAEPAKPSVSPALTPAAPAASSTPARLPQTTPRRIVPTPLNTPVAGPRSSPPAEATVKPSPRSDLAPRPVAPPPVTQPPQVATPPANASPPPNETKPGVRHTPPAVRTKPTADPAAIPPASAMPSPPTEDQKENNTRPKRPRPVEGEKPTPTPTPTGSPAP